MSDTWFGYTIYSYLLIQLVHLRLPLYPCHLLCNLYILNYHIPLHTSWIMTLDLGILQLQLIHLTLPLHLFHLLCNLYILDLECMTLNYTVSTLWLLLCNPHILDRVQCILNAAILAMFWILCKLYIQGSPQEKLKAEQVGVVCDHINHLVTTSEKYDYWRHSSVTRSKIAKVPNLRKKFP